MTSTWATDEEREDSRWAGDTGWDDGDYDGKTEPELEPLPVPVSLVKRRTGPPCTRPDLFARRRGVRCPGMIVGGSCTICRSAPRVVAS